MDETKPSQKDIDEAYKDMMFWLLLIKARALQALAEGKKADDV